MKKNYQTPHIEIINVQNEGVMAMSDVTGGGEIFNSPSPTSTSAGVPGTNSTDALNELEDLLNNLLTQ
ncbi:hypothetical protein D0T50_11780 [Bacteroides sp. 214]|uniref:hypothetical protein n=1 Tax=Bacteroides sp. 214 TaxID=2302935 RepID=UPI0013D1D370|nr:hypothetical protein [Bacteroides sp. 214]NDW13564.1 hypothetical protein [Bacteroides sp. 214]